MPILSMLYRLTAYDKQWMSEYIIEILKSFWKHLSNKPYFCNNLF